MNPGKKNTLTNSILRLVFDFCLSALKKKHQMKLRFTLRMKKMQNKPWKHGGLNRPWAFQKLFRCCYSGRGQIIRWKKKKIITLSCVEIKKNRNPRPQEKKYFNNYFKKEGEMSKFSRRLGSIWTWFAFSENNELETRQPHLVSDFQISMDAVVFLVRFLFSSRLRICPTSIFCVIQTKLRAPLDSSTVEAVLVTKMFSMPVLLPHLHPQESGSTFWTDLVPSE